MQYLLLSKNKPTLKLETNESLYYEWWESYIYSAVLTKAKLKSMIFFSFLNKLALIFKNITLC